MANFDRLKMREHIARQDEGYAARDAVAIRNSTLQLKSRIHKELFLLAMIVETYTDRPTPRRLLEVGCGIGSMTGALRSCADEVVAFDLSPAGIREAQDRYDRWPGITLVVADGTDPAACPSIKEGNFDLILFREFHPFSRDFYSDETEARHIHARIIGEYMNLLAPGGLLIISHGERHRQAIRPDKISLPNDASLLISRSDPRFLAAFLFLTRNRLSRAIDITAVVLRLAWLLMPKNVLYVLQRDR